MNWDQKTVLHPSPYNGQAIRHACLSNAQGTSILFDKSIWGVFNILKYQTPVFTIDLSIAKSTVKSPAGGGYVAVDAFLLSDIANFIRKNARANTPYELTGDDIDRIKNDLATSLSQWKNLFHADDGPLGRLGFSPQRLNWYLAEEHAMDPRQSAYWLNITELGFNIDKAITEHIANGTPFRIAEENQLWEAAGKRFADQASGNIRVIT